MLFDIIQSGQSADVPTRVGDGSIFRVNPEFFSHGVLGTIHNDPPYQLFELLNVSRPVITGKKAFHFSRKLKMAAAGFNAELVCKKIGQRRDIIQPSAQRRNINPDDIEAVKQILTEFIQIRQHRQVSTGGGDNPHVVRIIRRFINTGLIDHLEQCGLGVQRYFTDFLQQQGAIMRRGKDPLIALLRVFQHQQLFLKEISRQLRHIHFNKRPVAAL